MAYMQSAATRTPTRRNPGYLLPHCITRALATPALFKHTRHRLSRWTILLITQCKPLKAPTHRPSLQYPVHATPAEGMAGCILYTHHAA